MPATLSHTRQHDFLNTVATLVATFLRDNGGMGNGYETWVKGRPERGGYGPMDWQTPTMKDLTGHEVDAKARGLKNAILGVMREYDVARVEIVTSCDTGGCYETIVRWVNPEPPQVAVRL